SDRELDAVATLLPCPADRGDSVDQEQANARSTFVAATSVAGDLFLDRFGNELLSFTEAHHVHVVLRKQPHARLAHRGIGVADEGERSMPVDVDLFEVEHVE